ncbi:hypothetical protein D3C85_1552520 [compost metagenome]
MGLMAVDSFQFYRSPVDEEHAVLNPDLPESDPECQHFFACKDINAVQIRLLGIP